MVRLGFQSGPWLKEQRIYLGINHFDVFFFCLQFGHMHRIGESKPISFSFISVFIKIACVVSTVLAE